DRHVEIERLDDHRFEDRGIELAADERTQHAQRDIGQRPPRQPRQLGGRPRFDRLGDVQAAVGREPLVERVGKGDGGAAARRYVAHADTTRAPRGAIADTYVWGSPAMWRRTASVIARATRFAASSPRHRAKSDGPEPDRLQPSAPASAAARLIADSPGTSGARRGSATASSSERDIRSKSPRCSASTNAPRFAHCRIASASGTCVPSSARARAVSISRSGWTTTAARSAGTGSRTMSGGFADRTSTNPPYRHGAMLSA